MKKKRAAQFAFFNLRASVALLVCGAAACSMLGEARLAFFRPEPPAKVSQRTLTFAERVAYQRAIEEVYWRHRIWPKENASPKPPLEKVMSQAQIEKKVEDYLRDSQALEDYWQRPVTPDQLQSEMERIASHTKQPGVLRELFAALGNDPFLIAECLARPVLAERLLTELYAHDERFHGELKRRAEAELKAHPSVRQMKQTSGAYSEIELVRSDSASAQDEGNRGAEPGLTLNSREWDESVQKLAAKFGRADAKGFAFAVRRHVAAFESADMSAHSKNAAADEYETLPIGKLSPLQEDDGHYYAVAVMKKGKDRLKLATVAWLKEPLRSWLAKAEAQVPVTMAAVSANYTLPVISSPSDNRIPSGTCTDDTWTPTRTTNAPDARAEHTAVWTGSEMIVWGGTQDFSAVYLDTGGRYNPSTDSWTATSTTNAPAGRYYHTAVWTGSEMIVWGGNNAGGQLNTGGRYNPSTDSWIPTSFINAPVGRSRHTAVWTGSEMTVWGGYSGAFGYLNTGGSYNPSSDSWRGTSTSGAPSARHFHTAVWSGSEMIVWGGVGVGSTYLNTGGRYNPSTDSWVATSTTGAPSARWYHTAVWAGVEMIVWGGWNATIVLNTGGRYDPSTDSWTPTSISNAPTARADHSAVWTGSEMIIWGGTPDSLNYPNTGGRYNPSTDWWTATSTTSAPDGRQALTAVWTGSEMIVWGGTAGGPPPGVYFNTGGRYCVTGPAPTPTPTPTPTASPTPTSTATPTPPCIEDTWTPTSLTNAPAGREVHTAVWTGSEVIVWGGFNGPVLNTGGRYNPGTDSWTAISTTNAPTARFYHTVVWTGVEMIVWGGEDANFFTYFNTGGRYNPSTDSWTATSTINAPHGRAYHTAVWTGSEMIAWGAGTTTIP